MGVPTCAFGRVPVTRRLLAPHSRRGLTRLSPDGSLTCETWPRPAFRCQGGTEWQNELAELCRQSCEQVGCCCVHVFAGLGTRQTSTLPRESAGRVFNKRRRDSVPRRQPVRKTRAEQTKQIK